MNDMEMGNGDGTPSQFTHYHHLYFPVMNNHSAYLGGLHTRIRLLETPVHFIAGTQQVFAE